MAESVDKNQRQGAENATTSKLHVEDDIRLKYLGFDVGSSKTGELYKNPSEQEKYLDEVRKKRERQDILRGASNFREDRISGTEKYILIAASLVVLITFFLPITPWVSGYFEVRTEVPIGGASKSPDDQLLGADASADSTAAVAGTTAETPTAPPASAQRSGFQELQVKKTRIKIDRTPFRSSGMQILTRIGMLSSDVFSSGIALKLTGILFIIFVISVFGTPLYIIYSVLTIKGNSDEVALKLKKALRFGWYPTLIWFAMLALSVVGADYGFDTSEALKQVGESYGLASFLGLTGSGLYISLVGCIFAGAKSVEI